MTRGDAPRPSADGETLPGTGDTAGDDADRVVCHVDMDCFYASCERLRRPSKSYSSKVGWGSSH